MNLANLWRFLFSSRNLKPKINSQILRPLVSLERGKEQGKDESNFFSVEPNIFLYWSNKDEWSLLRWYTYLLTVRNMFIENKVVKYRCLLDTLFNYCHEKSTMSRLITSNLPYSFIVVKAKCMLPKRIYCNQHDMKLLKYEYVKVNRIRNVNRLLCFSKLMIFSCVILQYL